MCTVSTVIDGWRDPTWPYRPEPHTVPSMPFPTPIQPGPNAIPWPTIQSDPALAQQMLEILKRLEAIDKRLGMLEQCVVSEAEKTDLKKRLEEIAQQSQGKS